MPPNNQVLPQQNKRLEKRENQELQRDGQRRKKSGSPQEQQPQQLGQVVEEVFQPGVVSVNPFSYEILSRDYFSSDVGGLVEIPKKEKLNRIIMLIPSIDKKKFSQIEKDLFECLDWCHRQKMGSSLVNNLENILDLALLRLGVSQPYFNSYKFYHGETCVNDFIEDVRAQMEKREAELREEEALRAAFSADNLTLSKLQVFVDAVFKQFNCIDDNGMLALIKSKLKLLNRQAEVGYISNSSGVLKNTHELMKCHAAICMNQILKFRELSPEEEVENLFLIKTDEDGQEFFVYPAGVHALQLLKLFNSKFVDGWLKTKGCEAKTKKDVELKNEIIATYNNFVDTLCEFITIESIPVLNQLIVDIDDKLNL
ncbi:MAG: hypothetical protein ChlgKO_11380 [Chlamydiales bacterium]